MPVAIETDVKSRIFGPRNPAADKVIWRTSTLPPPNTKHLLYIYIKQSKTKKYILRSLMLFSVNARTEKWFARKTPTVRVRLNLCIKISVNSHVFVLMPTFKVPSVVEIKTSSSIHRYLKSLMTVYC